MPPEGSASTAAEVRLDLRRLAVTSCAYAVIAGALVVTVVTGVDYVVQAWRIARRGASDTADRTATADPTDPREGAA